MARQGFTQDFRRFFFRGLAAILPAAVTIGVIAWVLQLIHKYFAQFVNKGVEFVYVRIWAWETEAEDLDVLATRFQQVYDKYLFWVGFLLSVVFIYLFGRFLASLLGRYVWRWMERTMARLPVLRQVYPSVKQVTDFLLTERKMEFSRVVAVEYPRKGVWSIGLVTNRGMRTIADAAGSDLLTVFIPSSPTPVTGYTITVRRDEVLDLPITIDEALRFTISGGVIQPTGQARDEPSPGVVLSQLPAGQEDKETRE